MPVSITIYITSESWNSIGEDFTYISSSGNQSFEERRKKQRRDVLEDAAKTYLSQEVQEEILVRLPVKSLVRFKSVCKPWRSLIESRDFIDLHRSRRQHQSRDYILFSPYTTTRKEMKTESSSPLLKLSPGDGELSSVQSRLHLPRALRRLIQHKKEWSRVVRVLGPLSNGIYCLVVNLHDESSRRTNITTGKIALCNPVTRDYKLTKPFPYYSHSLLSALTQCPSRVHYGFGGSHDEDYKVVVIISWGPRFSTFLSFVYSFQRGTWRKLADYEDGKRNYRDTKATQGLLLDQYQYPEITPDLELCPQTLFRGCWHWMAIHSDYTCSVLSFDFADEAFTFIAAPGYQFSDIRRATDYAVTGGGVLVLNDHLGAVYCSAPCVSIDVWMMMEYRVKDSWTKIYSIQPNFYGYFSKLVGISSQPLSDDDVDGGGIGIQSIFFEDQYNKKLISCDSSGYEEIDVFGLSSAMCWNTLGVSTYMETLEPLPNHLYQ